MPAPCARCGQQLSRVQVTQPGWVVARCACGWSREITSDEALNLRRIELVKQATVPERPPVGLSERRVEHDESARLRALALDMWRRGTIDDEAYHRALARIDA